MPIIESRINTRSQDYTDNARAMQAQLDDLNQQLARTALGGTRPRAPSTWRAASCCRVTASNS